MAYLENSIDAKQFASLTGPIFYQQQQVEVIERPGVTGSGLRRLGVRGKPFTLTSKTYCDDFADAADFVDEYNDLVGEDPVVLIRNGVGHGNYLVLEVQEVETIPVLNATGNVPVGATACLICSWKLLG